METNKVNKSMIQDIGGVKPSQDRLNQKPLQGKGPSFADLLEKQAKIGNHPTQANLQTSGIKFSNHAIERIRSRGIQMGPDQMAKLETAVEKAQAKGAKETLVLMDNTAMIVNIKNKTVVTALDQGMMKDNVFTNIDSTVIL